MPVPSGMLDGDMSRRGTSPVLIGRGEQMAALEAAFAAVQRGGPSAVLVGGEAGVGKTRLVSEFIDAARRSGARVLAGGCLELGADGLPFGPFTAMLRALVRELGRDGVTGLLPGGGPMRELARLLPELRGPASGDGGFHSGAPAAGEARARLFEEFLTVLERLADAAPLVVVIEDMHWADRSSRDLLAFLIGYQRALSNTLIVATFRSDELHRTHPLRPLLAELSRVDWVERIDLPRLTRREAAELAAAIHGGEHDRELTDALYRRAEGNPLFTEELLCRAGCLAAQIPDTLADLLLQAVRRLPEETQEVLRVASAGSGASSHALLAKVTGCGEDELTRVLRPAVTGNVLVTSDDGYAFRHALIREAVHEDLLPGEHGQVHARFAGAIDADPALVADGRAEIEKAHHWYSAHDTTWALISAWQASLQAGRSVAHAERLMLLARVLELWDQVPDAAVRIGADHARVYEEAVAAAVDAGEDQRGMAFATAAITELDETAEPVRVALLLQRRYSFRKHLGLPLADEDLERALRLVPEDVAPQARAQVLLTVTHWGEMGQKQKSLLWADESLRISRATGDPAAQAQALLAIALAQAFPGSLATSGSDTLAMIAQARELALRAGAYRPACKAAVYESHLLCGAGEYERAVAVARQGKADSAQYGLTRTSGAFLAINVAEPLLASGAWDEGLRVAEEALDLAPPPMTRAGLWIASGLIAAARGDTETAASRAAATRAVLATARYEDQYHLALGWLDVALRLASGDPAAAVAAAAAAIDSFDLPASSPRYCWPLLATAARAARIAASAPGPASGTATGAASGHPDGAASGHADAVALMERLRGVAETTQAYGLVQHAWRLTFAAIAPPVRLTASDRLTAWDAAVAAWEAVRQPYETATALVDAANTALELETGRDAREEAARRLRLAAPLAAGLAARPLTDEILSLARRAGITLTGNGSAGAGRSAVSERAGFGLTAREFEVLRLVAAGQSNQEIADTLFITRKTASVHVSNILGKLGIASRTEAAAKAHALRLFDGSASNGTAASSGTASSSPAFR
jgi:DNA-binding CsgD family transcriptional regulator